MVMAWLSVTCLAYTALVAFPPPKKKKKKTRMLSIPIYSIPSRDPKSNLELFLYRAKRQST